MVRITLTAADSPTQCLDVPEHELFDWLSLGPMASADVDSLQLQNWVVRDVGALEACLQAYPALSCDLALEGEPATITCTGQPQLGAFKLLAAVEALQCCHTGRRANTPGIPTHRAGLYAQSLAAVEAPYVLRYTLLRNAAKSLEEFSPLQAILTTTSMQFQLGHTQRQRQDAIEPHLPGGDLLVEVGCGPAYYLRRLTARYKRLVGFEADPGVKREAHRLLHHHGVTNAQVFGAFDERAFVPAGAHVLMTEVLEHMPKETSVRLLQHLAGQQAARMVFTVPNHAFNRHYLLPDGAFRHPDHYWEPGREEFEALMRECLGTRWTLQFEPVGDTVAGESSGFLCVALPAARETWLGEVLGATSSTAPKVRRRFS